MTEIYFCVVVSGETGGLHDGVNSYHKNGDTTCFGPMRLGRAKVIARRYSKRKLPRKRAVIVPWAGPLDES